MKIFKVTLLMDGLPVSTKILARTPGEALFASIKQFKVDPGTILATRVQND